MKVHLRSLGCRLNQAEMDALGRNLLQRGHEITGDPKHAGEIVVNTCSVTREAGADSRALVRELGRRAPAARITVTGCHAELAPQELRSLPNVRRVVGNMDKEGIFDWPDAATAGAAATVASRPGTRTRAFVKVQDGCDHACTFCVTTLARGPGRSRPLAEVLADLQQLHSLDYGEAVLSGVQLGSYGRDLGMKQGLAELLRAILAETDIPRLRLSSLEPWDLTPDLPDLWQDARLCRHLHLPLQSGCAATLRRMRRRCSPEEFSALLRDFRARVPHLRVTTDVIVGFPGEDEREYRISRDFIARQSLAGLHVFRFSPRPGTPATRMRRQVPESAKRERSAGLRRLGETLTRDYARGIEGQTQEVLWEQVAGATPEGFVNVGYTDTWMRVRAIHPRPLSNEITAARLGRFGDGEFQATPIL